MRFNVDDLIQQGLVRKKTYTTGLYKGLSVLKYTKKVFYNNLWHKDERLLECRGIVVDEEDNVIVLPFKKVFNLSENNTEIDQHTSVIAPVKVNGFMCAVTNTDKYGLIVSTTGTLDSEFAIMARKWIEEGDVKSLLKNNTYLFEICDKDDVHVVLEDEGAYLIGIRGIYKGGLVTENYLDKRAKSLGYKRPKVYQSAFVDILNMLSEVKHEGFMIRDLYTAKVLCKLKSPHYLSTKAFHRMGKNRVDLMFDNPKEFRKQIDEEFYDFHQYLLDGYTKEMYYSLTQDERRIIFGGGILNETRL